MTILKIIPERRPLLILAPMQDVTDLPFWRVIHHYGSPDLLYTEYFRVHRDSRPERHILKSLRENPTGSPVQAQMIGEDIPSLIRTAEWLQKERVLGIDLNLGCPAPIVCSKKAGGGLLRDREHIDAILKALRPAIHRQFTVKTRIGFESPEEFGPLLELFSRHAIDALTVHGRTVREMYQPRVHHNRISDASNALPFPVFANGNVLSPLSAQKMIDRTGVKGLMIGRGAIRNPWIFQQIRDHYEGRSYFQPTLLDLREYIDRLYRETRIPEMTSATHVSKMKKYLNFIAPGIGADDAFLHAIRRVLTEEDFFKTCDAFLNTSEHFDPEKLIPNPDESKS